MPMPVEQQVLSIWAGANGFLDDVPVAAVRRFETDWLVFLDQQYAEVVHNVRTAKTISQEDDRRLKEAATSFKAQFKA